MEKISIGFGDSGNYISEHLSALKTIKATSTEQLFYLLQDMVRFSSVWYRAYHFALLLQKWLFLDTKTHKSL